jgi:hypothetical protein
MLRRALVLGGLLVMLAVVGSVAWATTSASDKLVACATKSSGSLRLVGAAKNCRKTERAVVWSANAQPGPRGPAGARGPAGDDGADGTDGIDGVDGEDGVDGDDGYDGVDGAPGPPGPATKWLYVDASAVMIPQGTQTTSSATCPSLTVPHAVNGGIRLGGPTTVHVTASAPVGTGATATAWQVQVENTSAITASVTVWVLCANGTAGP